MDIFSLSVSLALLAGVLALILYPLWQQQTHPEVAFQNNSGQSLEEYQARYQAALETVRDLMFDYEMGKSSPEDYEKLLTHAKLEAAEIRRQIDRLNHTTNTNLEATFEVEIEKLIAQIRTNRFDGYEPLLTEANAEIDLLKVVRVDITDLHELACPHCDKSYWPGDTFCSGCGQPLPQPPLTQTVCPACGHPAQPDDAFCARCGTALNHATPLPGQPEVISR